MFGWLQQKLFNASINLALAFMRQFILPSKMKQKNTIHNDLKVLIGCLVLSVYFLEYVFLQRFQS